MVPYVNDICVHSDIPMVPYVNYICVISDIPMVPAMSSSRDSKKLSFVAHWLNNKELQFSHGAEKILEEMSRKSNAMENLDSGGNGTDGQTDSDEVTSDSATDTGKDKGKTTTILPFPAVIDL